MGSSLPELLPPRLYGDGSQHGFVVEARTTYLETALPLEAMFGRMGPPALTLFTCGGGFDSSVSSYDSNVVVYATPVGGSNDQDGPSNIN